jgi:hypothetical protein
VSNATTNTLTEEGRIGLNLAVATAQTDEEHAFALDVSKCVYFYMSADQGDGGEPANVLIQFNDGAGTGGDFDATANIPYIWYTGKKDAFAYIGADLTSVFVTNTSGSTVNIIIEALYTSDV